jgi:hypothetical protein
VSTDIRRPRTRRRIVGGVSSLALGATLLAGCGTGSTGASAGTASGGSSAVATEVNPPGDIPDNQAFVAYQVPGTSVSVKVPEGWSQSGSGRDVTFTDKLNSVEIAVSQASTAPTVESVKSTDVPSLKTSVPNFALQKVETVQRKAGEAVLLTYQADSAPDSVTNKVVRDAVERYTFFTNGTRVDLTLAGPQNADNVDPWRVVSDSVTL